MSRTMKYKKLEILIIAFISLKLFVFQWVNPEPTLTLTGQDNSRTYGLLNYTNNVGNPGVGSVDIYGHKLFVNTGDANFYMANITTSSPNQLPNTSSIFTHNFGSGTFLQYAELTGIYRDKDDPPKRITSNIPNGVSIGVSTSINSTELSTVALNPVTSMKFTPIRRVVPNNSFSMILSVAPVQFHEFDSLNVNYDNVAFKTDQLEIGNTPFYTITDIGNGNIRILKTSNSNIRDYPYHITLSFKTNPLPLGYVSGEFTATIGNFKSKPPRIEVFNDPNALRVVNSHDPNNKTFIPSYYSDSDGNVKVLINFQNEGDGPTSNVVIVDELDQAILNNMVPADIIEIQNSLKLTAPVVNSSQPNFSYQNGKIKVELCGLELRGKNEKKPDGSIYPESETMGSLSYTLRKSLLENIQPCHSVINSAQIFFDCNPPIITDLAYLTRIEPEAVKKWLDKSESKTKIAKIYLKGKPSDKEKRPEDKVILAPWVEVDSICHRAEVFCEDAIKNEIDLNNFNKAGSICGLNITNSASFRWYPTSPLIDPLSKSLNFKPSNRLLKQNFALLVSQNAQETTVHVPVDMCNLTLSYTWRNGKYHVEVLDSYMLPNDELVWNVKCNSCNGQTLSQRGASVSRNGRTVKIENPGDGDSRLITVYNPNTGCSAEVEIPHHSRGGGLSWWRWAQILMGVFLLVFLIWSVAAKKSKKTGGN